MNKIISNGSIIMCSNMYKIILCTYNFIYKEIVVANFIPKKYSMKKLILAYTATLCISNLG